MNTLEGKLVSEGIKVGIVAGRFNEFITSKLIGGAMDGLLRHDVKDEDVDIAWVPGAFEIPLVAQKMAESGKYDAVICLGAVIRGATSHYDLVCNEAAKGVAQVGLKTGVPVLFGVVTTDTIEQAIERAGTKAGNKGYDCALSAVELVNLIRKEDELKKHHRAYLHVREEIAKCANEATEVIAGILDSIQEKEHIYRVSGTPSAFDMDEEDEDEDDFVTIPKEKYDSMIEDLLTMAELIDMVSDMRTKDVRAIQEFGKFIPAYAAYERNRLSLYREAAKEAESIIDRWEDELDEDEDYEPDEYFSD